MSNVANCLTQSRQLHQCLPVRATVAATAAPVSIAAQSYSYLDGVAMSTTLEMDMGEMVPDPAAVRIELGTGVVADELRSLGLPATPDFASWGEHLAAVFHLGEPVAAGSG